jgi:hypothetical protein
MKSMDHYKYQKEIEEIMVTKPVIKKMESKLAALVSIDDMD